MQESEFPSVRLPDSGNMIQTIQRELFYGKRNDNIRDLYRSQEAYAGQTVTVGGWVRSIRDSKTFGFMVISDGTFFETLQVVYADGLENLRPSAN